MAIFKKEAGDWTEYRKLDGLMEHDFHRSEGKQASLENWRPHTERMEDVYYESIQAVKAAQQAGKKFVLFTHGTSTSRPGKTTSRSQVRKAMRSPEATPFVIRKDCIQHYSVFVAAIRPLAEE